MPDATALDQATTMIEKAWGRPIEALESIAVRRPTDDPLLRSAMHIRSALLVTADSSVAVTKSACTPSPALATRRPSTTCNASPAPQPTFASPKPKAVRPFRRSAT